MAELLVRALGPLEVLVDGVPVRLGGRKQRTVLALLALRANNAVSIDQLVEVGWGDAPPPNPVAVLQVYVANLRKALEPNRNGKAPSTRIVGVAGGYRLRVDERECDLLTFQALRAQAGQAADDGDLSAAHDALHAALELWRGDALPDLADTAELEPELARWEEHRLTAVEELLELDLALGRHGDVVAQTEELVALHPFRERIRAARVLALYRDQRQAEALAACRAAREQLADELGLDPGPELSELEDAVLRHDPSLTRSPSTGRARAAGRVRNLPTPLSRFVGRLREIDELVQLLIRDRARLLTLTGPGGTGKTRLALEVAASCGEAFADGVCWVPLDRIRRPEEVIDAIRDALDLPPAAGQDKSRVLAFLRTRRLLLVLDNFEHVLDAWPIIPELLTGARGLSALVTSRIRLDLTGEQVFRVPPLELPVRDPAPALATLRRSEAVALFEDRARLAAHGWQPADRDAGPLASICHRLDGLPLALELAAARSAELGLPGLQAALDDALGVLTGGPRDVADRQRTLHATIAWSHDLLSDDARLVFPALGVFAATPDRQAIAAVLAAPADAVVEQGLETLARASLVQAHGRGDGRRFALLQTVRGFARSLLPAAELAAYRRRHAQYVLQLAEANAPALNGAGQVDAFRRLDADRAEIATALEWAVEADDGHEIALRLIGTLWHFWEIAGDVERPRELAERILTRDPDAPAGLRGPALTGAGTLAWLTGDLAAATAHHVAALAAYGALDDHAGMALATMCLATQAVHRGDLAEGRTCAEQALTLARIADQPRMMCAAQLVLGVIALYEQRPEEATHHQHDALALARQAEDQWLAGKVLINLANIEEHASHYNAATAHLRETLLISSALGDRHLAVFAVEAIAGLVLRADRPRRAIRLFAAADRYRTEKVQPLDDHERGLVQATISRAAAVVGSVRFAAIWAEGQQLDLDAAVAEALSSAALTSEDPLLRIA